MTNMLTPQKTRKQTNCGSVMPERVVGPAPPSDGKNTPRILWIASPPIQVWMPNQPQATSARNSAGTLAPLVPKAARQ